MEACASGAEGVGHAAGRLRGHAGHGDAHAAHAHGAGKICIVIGCAVALGADAAVLSRSVFLPSGCFIEQCRFIFMAIRSFLKIIFRAKRCECSTAII